MQVFPHRPWWSTEWFHMYFMSTPSHEVSGTVYLGVSWWFVIMVHSASVPVFEQGRVTRINGWPLSIQLHSQWDQSAEQCSQHRIARSLSVSLQEDFVSQRYTESIDQQPRPSVNNRCIPGQIVEMETFQKEPSYVTNILTSQRS